MWLALAAPAPAQKTQPPPGPAGADALVQALRAATPRAFADGRPLDLVVEHTRSGPCELFALVGAPEDLGAYPDRTHYRMPEPAGFRSVYGMAEFRVRRGEAWQHRVRRCRCCRDVGLDQ